MANNNMNIVLTIFEDLKLFIFLVTIAKAHR